MTDHAPIRDPDTFAIIAEGARLALLKVGPHSGLIGPAAGGMDRQPGDSRAIVWPGVDEETFHGVPFG